MVKSAIDVFVVVRAYRQFPCGQIVPYGDIYTYFDYMQEGSLLC